MARHGAARRGGPEAASSTVPYWLDAPYAPRAALQGTERVDACVIGGGIGGLSCAMRLAEHGLSTAVLEARTVAAGASGRNGGFLLAGAAPFHVDARERYGRETARALYARTLEAQEQVYALAGAIGAGDAVRRVGCVRLAASAEEEGHVRRHAAALREDGFPAEVVEAAALPPRLARIGAVGCLTPGDGALHPGRWIRALAAAAERAGARVYEGSAALGPIPAPGEGPLRTAGGASVTAGHVVVAADGPLPALVPALAARLRARRLHMIATAPLGEHVADGLVYARWGLEYFQQLPDGRLLAGGFSDLDGERSYTARDEGSPEVWGRLERYVRDDLGLAEAAVTHRWAGVVAYGDDGRPYAGAVPGRPGLHVLGGYCGHGNLLGWVGGRAVADAIATGRAPDLGLLAPPPPA
jgi:glycine/D-amino acid oxidase-like deaminating enzyme